MKRRMKRKAVMIVYGCWKYGDYYFNISSDQYSLGSLIKKPRTYYKVSKNNKVVTWRKTIKECKEYVDYETAR
jgi:hypothetical protein